MAYDLIKFVSLYSSFKLRSSNIRTLSLLMSSIFTPHCTPFLSSCNKEVMKSILTDNMDLNKNDAMYTGRKEEFYDCVEPLNDESRDTKMFNGAVTLMSLVGGFLAVAYNTPFLFQN